jgi:hypothetical protein
LIFISFNILIQLIKQKVVVEFISYEGHDGVDSVILCGDVVDGSVAYEYGEDETYDGG